MNNDKQVKQRQLDNERILVKLLRDKKAKEKSKIEQLRADVADIARERTLKVVEG